MNNIKIKGIIKRKERRLERLLCQFSFENFRSYKGEVTFDLQAKDLPEFTDSLICGEKGSKLLPVSVIYGPNGGGKTTLLQALACLVTTVVRPVQELEQSHIPLIIQQRVTAEPFLFDPETSGKPTEFLLYFRVNGYEYRYYLALMKGEIIGEVLDRKKVGAKKPAHIFDRDEENIDLGPMLKREGVNTKVSRKMPYLSFLTINYNIPVIEEVVKWFEMCIIRNYANPKAEKNIFVFDDPDYKRRILAVLNDMGIDITDYRFDEENEQLYLTRQIQDKSYELGFYQESDGTRKLLAALPVIILALRQGCLTVIDELDAKLHPKLLRYVINMFKNKRTNPYGAQLIFTSHDMATMKNTVFRRDEIWFAALDENHSSELYSLYDIRREDNQRVNRTASFDKQYLEGRYGADPYLQNMLNWGDWM